jgi:uncharacterized protein YlzI (FlbEa/FlbD family)
MIRLFRLDGLELMLNVDMIKEIRPGPPLAIILLDGETIQVKNSLTDVVTKIKAYRKGVDDENRELDPGARKSPDRKEKTPSR